MVSLNLTVTTKQKAWLESFEGGKSKKAREIFKKVMDAEIE